jgi:hypothetical protein
LPKPASTPVAPTSNAMLAGSMRYGLTEAQDLAAKIRRQAGRALPGPACSCEPQ